MRNLLPKSGFGRQVAMLASGTIIAQGFLVLLTPVLFRLYSAGDLDALSGFSALFFTLVNIMTLRLEQAVPIAEDKVKAIHVLRLSAVAAAATSLLIFLALLIFGKPISAALEQPLLARHPWILPVALLGGALYIAGASWFTREKKFKITARTTVTQAIAMGVIQIAGAFVLAAHGALALALGMAVGRSAGVGSFWQDIRKNPEWREKWNWNSMKALAVKYRSLIYFNTPSTFTNNMGLQIPAIMLTAHFPLGSAAAYYAATRLMNLPASLLSTNIAMAYQGHAAELFRTNPQEMMGLFKRTLRGGMKLSAVILVVGLSAPLWTPFVFGPLGGMAGLYTAILTPAACVGFSAATVHPTLVILDEVRAQFVVDFIKTGVGFLAFFLTAQSANATLAVAVFSGLSAVLYAVTIYLCWRALDRAPRTREMPAPQAEDEAVASES